MPRLVRVAAADDIPAGGSKAIEVDGRLVAVFNAGGGRYYASSPLCPHEDGPLADGVVEGPADRPSVIRPWHAFDFDLRTGACQVDPDRVRRSRYRRRRVGRGGPHPVPVLADGSTAAGGVRGRRRGSRPRSGAA